MGFIPVDIEDGAKVVIRGKRSDSEASIVRLPFYRSS